MINYQNISVKLTQYKFVQYFFLHFTLLKESIVRKLRQINLPTRWNEVELKINEREKGTERENAW